MQLLNLIIYISIFAVPLATIIPIKGTIVWYPQFLAFLLMGLLICSSYLSRFNKWIGIFLAYSALSYIFICNSHPRALICTITSFLGVALAYAVSKQKDTKPIYEYVGWVVLFQFLLVISQCFNVDPLFSKIGHQGESDIVGFIGSHNQLGIYSAISALLVSPFLSILAIIPLILSKTSSAVAGLLAGVLTLLWFRGFKKTFYAALLIGAIICVPWIKFDGIGKEAASERISLWGLSIQQVNKGVAVAQIDESTKRYYTANPLFGYGIGSFIMVSPLTQKDIIVNSGSHRYENAHNDLIQVLFEFGYIGLILMLIIVSSVINTFRLSIKTPAVIKSFSVLVVIAVCSMGVYVTHAPVSYFMMMLCLGLFYAEVSNANKSKIS